MAPQEKVEKIKTSVEENNIDIKKEEAPIETEPEDKNPWAEEDTSEPEEVSNDIEETDPFNEPAPAIVGDNVKLINTRWLEIISGFNRMTKALLKQSRVMAAVNNPEDTVFLVTRNSFSFEVLNRKEVKQEIEDAIQNTVNKKINIILKDAEKERINIEDI